MRAKTASITVFVVVVLAGLLYVTHRVDLVGVLRQMHGG